MVLFCGDIFCGHEKPPGEPGGGLVSQRVVLFALEIEGLELFAGLVAHFLLDYAGVSNQLTKAF